MSAMPEPPEIRILRGNPTPEEEAAVREAILKIWRDEQAEAARVSGRSGWVVAARAEATSAAAEDFRRDGDAWRSGLRIAGLGLVSVRRTGRGDSK
jgi:hypothetical protein